MAYNERLADRVRSLLPRGVTEREMFGGIGFMLGGNMAVGVLGDDLIIRVGPDGHDDALRQNHVRVFDYSGRPMKGWVYVASAGVRSAALLKTWVERGIGFARGLPKKK